MVKLYVAGGGDFAALKIALREGMHEFLKRSGLRSQPTIVACGTRRNAYERFCFAIEAGQTAFLLVDSEDAVAAENQSGKPEHWRPWHHLKARPGDGWVKPPGSDEGHCHLMVQCMENWLIADPATLASFFGRGFASKPIPKTANVEAISKAAAYSALATATKDCRTKSPYGKGRHSFKLLALTDPAKVAAASPWAARFIDALKVEAGA